MTSDGTHAWIRGLRSPPVIVLVSALVTALAFAQARGAAVTRYRDRFARDAALWAERVAGPVEQGLLVTGVVARALAPDLVPDAERARRIAAAALGPDTPLDAAGWMPLPAGGDGAEGLPIRLLAQATGSAAEVVIRTERGGGNLARLRRAAEAGRPALLWLPAGDAPGAEGLLVAVPIGTAPPGEPGLLRTRGFAVGLVSSTRLAQALRLGPDACPLRVEILDPYAPAGAASVRLFAPAQPEPSGSLARLLAAGWRDAKPVLQARAGWSIEVAPTPAYRSARGPIAHWFILLAGALLVGILLVDHLRTVQPTRARMRRLFRERGQRRQAETALHESQAMLRLVLDAIPVRVHWKDVHSVYRGCNRRFAEDAELPSPEGVEGKTDFDLPWAELAETYRSRDRQVLASGQPMLDYEQPRTTSDRQVRWLRQSKLPLRDAGGAIIGVLTAYEDVTERKRVADALQASERKYRELVQHANSVILRLSREGAVTFINEFGQRFFGYAEGEIVGRPAVGTIVPATEAGGRDLARLLAGICADPEAFQSNVNENVRRDGRRAWMIWNNKAVLDERGELSGVFCVGSDITEQRRAEVALRRAGQELEERVAARTAELSRANARLQELDRLKSEFLATMSHELRTPLNSIIGFTGILRQGMAGPVNAEQAKQLGMVNGSAMHLLSLINDLLDLSRIEAGKIEMDRRPYDFRVVVADVEASCHPAILQKRLAFRVELPGGALELVGDRKRCFQVLLNLVSNAVKFTERGKVSVTAVREGDHLRVTVADTGIGIRPEHLGMLFEAFRQVDGSARRIYEGTGLGLYLCRKLLGLMGGEIGAESVYGQGSRFSFTLPTRLPATVGPEVRA